MLNTRVVKKSRALKCLCAAVFAEGFIQIFLVKCISQLSFLVSPFNLTSLYFVSVLCMWSQPPMSLCRYGIITTGLEVLDRDVFCGTEFSKVPCRVVSDEVLNSAFAAVFLILSALAVRSSNSFFMRSRSTFAYGNI